MGKGRKARLDESLTETYFDGPVLGASGMASVSASGVTPVSTDPSEDPVLGASGVATSGVATNFRAVPQVPALVEGFSVARTVLLSSPSPDVPSQEPFRLDDDSLVEAVLDGTYVPPRQTPGEAWDEMLGRREVGCSLDLEWRGLELSLRLHRRTDVLWASARRWRGSDDLGLLWSGPAVPWRELVGRLQEAARLELVRDVMEQ